MASSGNTEPHEAAILNCRASFFGNGSPCGFTWDLPRDGETIGPYDSVISTERSGILFLSHVPLSQIVVHLGSKPQAGKDDRFAL